MKSLWILAMLLTLVAKASDRRPKFDAAPAINALGLDLYRAQIKQAPGQSLLLSPYSIASALAMTYAGADGETKAEMQRVLRFPASAEACSQGFSAFNMQMLALKNRTSSLAINIANRLYVQRGFSLRPEFLRLVSENFGEAVKEADFKTDSDAVRGEINGWVAETTNNRIKGLLPVGQPTNETRLTLVNALYFKAAWDDAFWGRDTKARPFHLTPLDSVAVPTMTKQKDLGYDERRGYTVVTVPYQNGGFQLLLLVPDAVDGLAKVEQKLTARALERCAGLPQRPVVLYLPKFKLEPETMAFGDTLKSLGLKTAFDQPRFSANFERMAPPQPDGYLKMDAVFHKTWLLLDEDGTEAAAATAEVTVLAPYGASDEKRRPVEVRVDRPFLFAIQHVETGACLFLGRVTDPRVN